MSDEESFVILGTSPTSSMQAEGNQEEFSSRYANISSTTIINGRNGDAEIKSLTTAEDSIMDPIKANYSLCYLPQSSINQHVQVTATAAAVNTSLVASTSASYEKSFAEQFLFGKIKLSDDTTDSSTASSMLKQFPSLYTSMTKQEDINKLESIVSEHTALKNNLQETNIAMRQHFATINKYQSVVKELKEVKEQQSIELNQMKETNDLLRNQITILEKEKKYDVDCYDLNVKIEKEVNADLMEEIRKKNVMIQELVDKVDKLEKQAQSFVMVESVETVLKQNAEKRQNELSALEINYEQSLKILKEANSKLLAENLEIQDMKKIYTDQVNCLQVNLVTAEELYNKVNSEYKQLESKNRMLLATSLEKDKCLAELKGDNDQLRADNLEMQNTKQNLSAHFNSVQASLVSMQERYNEMKNDSMAKSQVSQMTKSLMEKAKIISLLSEQLNSAQAQLHSIQEQYTKVQNDNTGANHRISEMDKNLMETTKKIDVLKDDNELLRAQVEIYKNDFEAERDARNDIANEREEILSDLKLLQRRNQQLIEERQKGFEGAAAATAKVSAEGPPIIGQRFTCPVCCKVYIDLKSLEHHIQECLK